ERNYQAYLTKYTISEAGSWHANNMVLTTETNMD
ncbi:uncharacterized protein METZ01_LOCUS387443, partial [marine metagenome]